MSTSFPTAVPSADTPSSDQLELFAPNTLTPHAAPPGLSRSAARALVSPGWWRLLDALYGPGWDLVVQTCAEVDGTLMVEATSDDAEDADGVAALLQHLRERAARTCGCCGTTPASAYRPSVVGPTQVVCARCRDRLRAGEPYLVVADTFFRLDGTPRIPPGTPPATHRPSAALIATSSKRPCTTLPPDELRQVIAGFRAALSAEIVGQPAVDQLALLAGLHVGGGLPRGGRALLLGPTGVGKSRTIEVLRRAMEDGWEGTNGGWEAPWIVTDALDLNASGWGGAPSIGDLLEEALRGESPDSPRARKLVVVVDEIHHAALIPGTHGNMDAKRREVLASLLGLTVYGTVHLGGGATEWSSKHALVIGMGAFTDLLDLTRPPTAHDLGRAGIPIELATRLTEQVILLRPLPERELRTVLRRWPALTGLAAVCERLGYAVRVHDEAYARAARAVMLGLGGATARTAGGWLVSALRQALLAALADPDVRELVITPDSLPVASPARERRPPNDPPDDPGEWDATIILTPR